jgi:hypothetical protein
MISAKTCTMSRFQSGLHPCGAQDLHTVIISYRIRNTGLLYNAYNFVVFPISVAFIFRGSNIFSLFGNIIYPCWPSERDPKFRAQMKL